MKCEYGCGEEAPYQLKNDKWCCSLHYNSCPGKRKRNSETSKGQIPWSKGKKGIHSEEGLRNISEKNKGKNVSEETREKLSKSLKGKMLKDLNPMYGKKHTEESKNKMSKNRKPGFIPSNKGKKGLYHQSEKERERSREFCLNGHSEYMNTFPKPKRSEETKEKHRKYMINGGAIKALRGVKNPSKPELMLAEIVKKVYIKSEFQFPILNYVVDIALPEYKIAIEYDGYFHFDTEKNKEYHKQRQEKIENEGWKFYRVTMFDKFPTEEIVKNNIEKLMEIK